MLCAPPPLLRVVFSRVMRTRRKKDVIVCKWKCYETGTEMDLIFPLCPVKRRRSPRLVGFASPVILQKWFGGFGTESEILMWISARDTLRFRGWWRWCWFSRSRSSPGTSCSNPPFAGCRSSAGTGSPGSQSGTAYPSRGTRSLRSHSRAGSGRA